MALEFEWDPAKRQANIRNHGVDFLDARKIFLGPVIEEIDNREDYGEERIIVLGRVGLLVLTVIYTKRGETIRIISARKANIDDEQIFYREIYDRGT